MLFHHFLPSIGSYPRFVNLCTSYCMEDGCLLLLLTCRNPSIDSSDLQYQPTRATLFFDRLAIYAVLRQCTTFVCYVKHSVLFFIQPLTVDLVLGLPYYGVFQSAVLSPGGAIVQSPLMPCESLRISDMPLADTAKETV